MASVSDAEVQQLAERAPLLEAVEDVLSRPVVVPERARLSARRQLARLYVATAITDIVSVSVGLYVAGWLAQWANLPRQSFLPLLTLVPVLVLAVFATFRLYAAHQLSPAEEFRRILLAVTLTITGLVFLSFWSKAGLSRLWLGSSWLLALVFTLFSRRVWHWFGHRARSVGLLTFSTLIVGVGEEAERLAELLQDGTLGYRPMGYVVPTGARSVGNGLPAVGHVRNLRDVIRDTGAECVFVASSGIGLDDMTHISQAVRREGVEVRITANLPQVLTNRLAVQPVGGVMALSVKPVRLTGTQAVVKRCFDLAVGSLLLLLTVPLMAVTALAVRMTSSGPALFRQERVTKDGRRFTMYKFRTMRRDADRALEGRSVDLTQPFFKLQDDPRVTRVGRLIRPLSLDELPQLWNVIRGDLSLVGPRPLPAEQVDANQELLAARHEVRAGITGWWQISGRSEVDPEDALRMDLFYIENWSLAYDLYILAKTIPRMLSGKGAV